jgi:hypothetical protein
VGPELGAAVVVVVRTGTGAVVVSAVLTLVVVDDTGDFGILVREDVLVVVRTCDAERGACALLPQAARVSPRIAKMAIRRSRSGVAQPPGRDDTKSDDQGKQEELLHEREPIGRGGRFKR